MVELVSPSYAMMKPGEMLRLIQNRYIRLHIIISLPYRVDTTVHETRGLVQLLMDLKMVATCFFAALYG